MKLAAAILSLMLWVSSAMSQVTLISTGAVWKYLANGVDEGAAWRSNSFDDASWPVGSAQFGWGEGDEQTLLFIGPATDESPTTTYYRKSFQVTNYIYLLTLRLLRDDGAIIYLNGKEVVRNNMPMGAAYFQMPALGVLQTNEGQFIQFGIFPDALRAGENVLAVEVHQAAGIAGWEDSSFDLELIANKPQTRPSVVVTAPLNGATVPVGIVTFTAAATDGDGHVERVEYYLNGELVEAATESPFMVDANVGPGRHVLRALAYDNYGYYRTSPPSYFQIGDEWPVNLLRGPYLQSGSSTGLVVRWRTDWLTNSVVRFGSTPDNLPFTATVQQRTNEHEVSLTALSPDTRYFYQVGSSSQIFVGGSEFSFHTSPTNARPVRIWVIGDAGTADANQIAVRDSYLSQSQAASTDLFLMLGDNAYESGTDSEYQAAVFDMYQEILNRVVLWPTIGNHEVSQPDEFAYPEIFTLPTSGESGGVPSGTEKYYSFDYANIHFVCLDSQISSRAAGSPMLNWLAEDLASSDKDWTIAFFHHPPYSFGSHHSDIDVQLIEMRERVLPILEEYGVDLVLTGHSHSYERSFLINGHYGHSSTLVPHMVLDSTLGRNEVAPYRKPAGGLGANRGTVYAVCGCSGQSSDLPFQLHPAMATNLAGLGSMILNVDGLSLNAQFLRHNGSIFDYFTIDKSRPATVRPRLNVVRTDVGVTLTWPTSIPLYGLETTASVVTNAAWLPLNAGNVTRMGQRHAVTLDLDSSNRFFRLRSP